MNADPDSLSEDEEEDDPPRPRSSSPQPSTSNTSTTQEKKSKKQKRSVDKEAEEIVDKLVQQEAQSGTLHDKISTLLAADTPASCWTAWINSVMPQMHTSVMNTFYKKSFNLVMDCLQQSEELFAQESRAKAKETSTTPVSTVDITCVAPLSQHQVPMATSYPHHQQQHMYTSYGSTTPISTPFQPVPTQAVTTTDGGLVWQSAVPSYGQPVAVPTTTLVSSATRSSGGMSSFLQDISFRGYTPNSNLNTPNAPGRMSPPFTLDTSRD